MLKRLFIVFTTVCFLPLSTFANHTPTKATSTTNTENYSSRIIEDRQQAAATFEEIEKDQKWISTLANEDIQSFPVGIKHIINEVEYQIGFHKANFNKDYTELTVFARVKLPQTDKTGKPIELYFGADNIKLSYQGGIFGAANLVLLGDIQIPFNGANWLLSLKGGADITTGDITKKTYVTIDCSGVKEMGIEGEVQFSRSLIIPVEANTGKALPATVPFKQIDGTTTQIPNRVSGSFNAVASNWNDLIVAINLPSFVLADQPDKFIFSANKATFDFSDSRNENVVFPKYYTEKGLLTPTPESWRGVYIQTLEVSLPKEFKTTESIEKKERVKFKATDLIIDSYGISGSFAAENIIPIKSGRTSDTKAWAYSVDKISIQVAANHLIGASFEGQIALPLTKIKDDSKETLGLRYKGLISDDEYLLSVSNIKSIDFSIWQAEAKLLPNSSIEFIAKDGNFRPKATLNGQMSISASNNAETSADKNKEKTVQFKGIEFQNLILQTESPIIQVGYFGYKGDIKLLGFPVTIGDLALTTTENSASLGFDLKINLMDKGFAADARLEIVGDITEKNNKQDWKFKKVDLKKVSVKADMGGFKLDGSLEIMDDDPEYGNGFSAELQVEMAAMAGILVKAKAIFGKKDFRYWYFDALVDNLPTGSAPTGITLKGFGGGAFYKMERTSFSSSYSPSGLSYKPSANIGFGLKAVILFGIINDKAINGSAGFEIVFNKNGGINKTGMYGEGHIMKEFAVSNPAAAITGKIQEIADANGISNAVDELSTNKMSKPFVDKAKEEYPAKISGEAGLNAYIGIEYDFENKVLHGEFDMYINVAGGIIEGRASGGRAGWAVLHLSREEWYLRMGTPTDRLGLKMGIGSISIEAGGYFMIGDNLPGSPPPPAIVAEILGVDVESLNYMRDENTLKNGGGFAFGQDFKIDTGNLKFLIFYGRFLAGGGYDIMLKNYGDAQCVNTGDQVGINGWYANGQAYAYMQGELGLKVKLFFKTKKISIIKGGSAVLLQTKAPNPIWMKGYLAGNYDLLGGLVKGHFRFKISIGKECKFEDASPLDGLKVITDITPAENANEVDVFAAPQVTFSMKVNEILTIPEDNGDKTYKIVLEKLAVVDANGKEIEGTIKWNNNNDRATFYSTDVLPPVTKLKIISEVSFQERINGVFQTIVEDGKKATEKEERNFVTGEAPKQIPLNNIQYCYPVIDQQNFYTNEYPTGYIQLQRGQDYLFDSQVWESELRITDTSGKTKTTAIQYNTADNKLSYTLPKLDNTTEYILSIISSPKSTPKGETGGGSKIESTNLGDSNTVEIKKNLAENVSNDSDLERLTYNFSSSKYDTFIQKIKDISITDDLNDKVNSASIYLLSRISSDESFEIPELIGTAFTDNKPLIYKEAVLDDAYYKIDNYPFLYQQYPINNQYFFSRNTELLGVSPKKAIATLSSYITSASYNVDSDYRKSVFPFTYRLAEEYENDFYDIHNQIINRWTSGQIPDTDPALQFLDVNYSFMRKGNYTIQLYYVLPGGIKNSSTTYRYKNTINIR